MSHAAGDEDEEQAIREAWPPTIAYITEFLKTAEGKEIAGRVLTFFESVRKQSLDRQVSESMLHGVARYLLSAGIIVAAVWLQFAGKLDTVMVGLLSLTLGYLLGRQQSK
ncbi:MAG TPA: hypothetical protein VMI75_37255 [Polyangiaceae bacterium]|nr:hypothetical protein [Polyangiaceae bacterium]